MQKLTDHEKSCSKKSTDALSKSDLLAVLLGSGIKDTNVAKLSRTIIKKFGQGFLTISINDLLTVSGIGKAIQIISAIALVNRITKSLFQINSIQ